MEPSPSNGVFRRPRRKTVNDRKTISPERKLILPPARREMSRCITGRELRRLAECFEKTANVAQPCSILEDVTGEQDSH
jgi:hypothetical protein